MWPNLYRCSVLCLWLAFCAGISGNAAVGQEYVPTPSADVDSSQITPGTLDRFHSPILRQDLKINSAQSCATSNCHAGPQPGVAQKSARRGMEYQLWIENDPHAQSWRTICSDESVAMMRRLKIMDGNEIVDQTGFDNCLACHNTTKRYDEPRSKHSEHFSLRAATDYRLVNTAGISASHGGPQDVKSFLREGVGCASCHGPSGRWINTHYQYHWSPQGATKDGFLEAGDLYVRARMCASCHVGDKDRDMNHDIIAAGHPTLRYELATFHAWQPKHWRDAEANDKTFYEAQLWLAGQVAASDASLALLQARAADAHSVSQWPEFAAYNCASCHHNLGMDNSRRPLGADRKATAIYSDWNDAGLRWLMNYRIETGEATEEDSHLITALDRVRSRMEAKPRPSADAVAEAAAHARKVLAQWLDGRAGQHERAVFRSDRLGRVVASAAGKRGSFESWESAVQFYLAAVAARESWPGGWQGPLKNVADRMQAGLSYPEMIDLSRYAKRVGRGPQLSRVEAMQLGIELAGWLGPVSKDPSAEDDFEDEFDGLKIQAEIDALLEEITERWRNQPLPPRSETPEPGATRPPRQQRPQQPRGQSIEDLRRSLEQLQSGGRETDN